MIMLHPSSLGKIMTKAKSKKDSDLSVGALTHCYELAKQFVYCYTPDIKSKAMTKGIDCEQDSIDLYNSVYGTEHVKNIERITNDWMTGECDIDAPEKIIDIKTSWSVDTFPATGERAHDTKYEWQGRAYMILYDKPLFELAFCLVSTPEELCKWEDPDLHYVDLIDPRLRVTTLQYERDADKDKLIENKCIAAQNQVEQFIEQITKEHTGEM